MLILTGHKRGVNVKKKACFSFQPVFKERSASRSARAHYRVLFITVRKLIEELVIAPEGMRIIQVVF
jgi:hypothetical protein